MNQWRLQNFLQGLLNKMPYEIKNHRIFINTLFQKDQTGIVHHSVHSHRLRKIIVVILEKILLCFHKNSTFSFDTFKVKLEDRIIYVNKGSYQKWRQSHFADLALQGNLKDDLLNLIEVAKKSAKQSMVHPKNEQRPIYSLEKVQNDFTEADHLVGFFYGPLSKDPETLKNVLESVKHEIFEEAIHTYTQDKKISIHSPNDRIVSWLNRIYPFLNEEQIEILVQTLISPEALVLCFPEDQNLLEKVANKISNNFNQMQSFFNTIDQLASDPNQISGFRLLIKSIVQKFLQKNPIEEICKMNSFGFNLCHTSLSPDPNVPCMIDIILQEVSFEMASKIFISSLQDPDNQIAFSLKVLLKIFKITSLEQQKTFSLALIEHIRNSSHAKHFTAKMLDFKDDEGPLTQTILNFAKLAFNYS